jgi:hypothetical protein
LVLGTHTSIVLCRPARRNKTAPPGCLQDRGQPSRAYGRTECPSADLNRRREAVRAEVGTVGNSADRVASKFCYKDSCDSLRHLEPDQRIGLAFRQALAW